MSIPTRLEQVKQRIRQAIEKAGRNPAEVSLVLVTKTVPAERIREAFQAGHREFGENRVQELLEKEPLLPSDIRWHFVGHLQTNKVKSLLRLKKETGQPVLIHSLDRMALAEEIQKEAEKMGTQIDALLQVNVSGETTKSGFSPEECLTAQEIIKSLDRLQVRGLMTIGPWTDDRARTRACFHELRELRDRLFPNFPVDRKIEEEEPSRELSMGMSSDFETAIEEGATIVRIGSAVFGDRREV